MMKILNLMSLIWRTAKSNKCCTVLAMVPDKFVTVNDQRNSMILFADQSQYSYLSEYTFWSLLLVDKPYWPVQIIPN